MSNKEQVFINLLSVSWDSAIISFSLPVMSIVEVRCVLPEEGLLAKTTEENFIGRIYLENLQPATQYKIIVKWSDGTRQLEFVTLPKPIGQCLGKFSAIADTHISEKKENRKGRLFVEATAILADIVEYVNEQAMDFVLVAGDVTNMSKECEYRQAKRILAKLNCKCYCVPGDHDVLDNGRKHWKQSFGEMHWVRDLELPSGLKLRLIGLDTSGRTLGKEGLDWLKTNVSDVNLNIVLSHFQLIPDEYIHSPNPKLILDYDELQEEIAQLCQYNMIIYVGHQNIPSRRYFKQSIQINLPQPVQFLCGHLDIRIYENGIYHKFVPIMSEVLNEHSREFSERASSHLKESHWRAEYRIGKSVYESNFVWNKLARVKAD